MWISHCSMPAEPIPLGEKKPEIHTAMGKQLIGLMVLAFLSSSVLGQRKGKSEWQMPDYPVTIYNTYSDFKNKKGTDVGMYKDFSWKIGGFTSIKLKNGKRIPMNKKWGCKVGPMYFRMYKREGLKRIHHVGKIAYYEGGFMHLRALSNPDGFGWDDSGEYRLYSLKLDSEILKHGTAKKLSKTHPELTALCNCLKKTARGKSKNERLDLTRQCIKKHNTVRKKNNE